MDSSFSRTLKILGEEGKTAQKSKENCKTIKNKENEKSRDWRVREYHKT